MFKACIRPGTLNILKDQRISKVLRAKNFYLAGGTGLALQLGHRISDDLDFFTEDSFELQELLLILGETGEYTVSGTAPGTLHLVFDEVTKASFLFYPYRLLFPVLNFEGCTVADYRDIAAMKIIALSQRGSKKDFVDLYFLLQGKVSIGQLKQFVQQKFAGVKYSWPHLVKSLGYFADAEEDPPPLLVSDGKVRELTSQVWGQVKEFLLGVQESALRRIQVEGRNA